jgi:hypothetical protein
MLLAGGWSAFALGLLILPIPVPLPLPVAMPLMLVGTAILTAHSRTFRHSVQFARYRYGWLSRSVENMGQRLPGSVRRTIHRTRPDLIERLARRQAGRACL